MRLALNPSLDPCADSIASTSDVFANGSVEFDHLRRHGKYLADGAGQWLRALAVVLRGVVVAQATLLLVMVLAGLAIGEIYALVPAMQASLSEPLSPAKGVGWAMAAAFLAALLCWLISVVFENFGPTARASGTFVRLWRFMFYFGLALVLVGLVVPLLVYASHVVVDLIPHSQNKTETTATAATTVLTTGFVATLVGIFTAVRKIATSATSWVGKAKAWLATIPAQILQRLIVIGGVVVLVSAHLFVFARVVEQASDAAAKGVRLPGVLRDWWLAGMIIVLVVLTLLADQTRWSLHPYYKKRLMSAFAVRRVRRGGEIRAEPYDFDTEVTDLHRYAAEIPGFPRVIFVAAANVAGQDLAPPGRRAVPYSMSDDWIGSPRLGWVSAEKLGALVSEPLRSDLTVQGAMALSGAAFASAMGAAGSAYSLLFALTNARLGSWLPNPGYVYRQREAVPGKRRWREPRLPRWRPVPYLVREIFGHYRPDGQMLLLTDGGHYDNLGLIELLRHQPDVAYCLDASGGANIAASALGPAITLAWQELGITVRFQGEPPPASRPADEPLGDWADRELVRTGVLVCTVDYPECAPRGAGTGTLYFGRAVVTANAPWKVQAYHRRNPTFPNDSTSDQWFGQEQFDAYHALGRHIGERVLAAREVGVQSGLTD